MSYLDDYRNRLDRYGINVGDVYKNSTEQFVNEKFSSSPTFRVATVKNNADEESEIDIRVIGVERLGSLREILLRPQESIELGSYLRFDENDWIVFDEYGTGITNKSMVAKCNRLLKWKDAEGKLHEYMCVSSASDLGSKSKQGKSEIEWNKYDIKLPRNQLFVFVPRNIHTDKIILNQRFIFGNRAYEVVGIDDTSGVDMDGFGVIQLTIRLHTARDGDDFITKVAENLYGNDSEVDKGGGRLW